ncbi:hypothetical protein ES703_52729 [subsurface metagenome]
MSSARALLDLMGKEDTANQWEARHRCYHEAKMTKNNQSRDSEIMVLRPSWLNYFGHFFLVVVLAAGAVACLLNEGQVLTVVGGVLTLIAFIVLLRALLERLSHEFTITPETVGSRVGIVSRHENEIRISDIREIGVRQGGLQRIFGIGSILFASAATGGIEVRFEGVRDPASLKNKVTDLRKSPVVADKKRCPQCGEFIWKGAKMCPHCHLTFVSGQEVE